ncbi:MAG: hypothetical protein IJU40_06095, partial [Desulfovibrionaceae bacterium]|nr:hypothetical protein [Desulfovibrionaceae bacterium]
MPELDLATLEAKLPDILDKLTKIKNHDIYFRNLSYKYFVYNPSENLKAEIYNEEVLKIIKDTLSLVEDFYKLKSYQKSCDLAYNILNLRFAFPSFPLSKDSFNFLSTHQLCQINAFNYVKVGNNEIIDTYVDKLCFYGILSAYYLDDLSKIYDLFKCSTFGYSLNNILKSFDQELPNFQLFLDKWIDYILKQEVIRLNAHLLIDAIFLLDSREKMYLHLNQCLTNYPQVLFDVYDQITASKEKSDIEILCGALDQIDKKLNIRSNLALKIAKDTKDLHLDDIYKKCILIGFESYPNFENYMRYALNFINIEDRKCMSEVLDNLTIEYVKNCDMYYSLVSGLNNEVIEL